VRRLVTLGVLLLAGCSWHGQGTVIQKDYGPSKTTTSQQCFRSSSKTTTCVPTSSTRPETWQLKIRDAAGEEHSVYVTEDEYEDAEIGDHFANGE
jgi:hypothetical protein